ncbi:hypothetical protein [Mycolicibacterium hodleri]|uniref:Uncharacterized protein n=1 Tax=Mycolicibacterium hodleri TaxID=49897 RepID=A0A502E1I3_9MYCO|nr:hypothetical protein [Mycolicibacterium hodleri]TPG31648.1 hypothetical protein EAH80_22090 [Mycolicibacterium hodleri]
MAKQPLRAVGEGERRPQRRKVLTVLEAAKVGSRRELLVAMRDRIAETVSRVDCPTKDLSPLTRRLQELDRDIARLDALEESEFRPPVTDDKFDASVI